MAKLERYHETWLAAHPYRTEAWLRERMAEGFDVHHIDGDHDNNVADNLMLIEHGDHMWLHGMGKKLHRLRPKTGPRKNKPWTMAEPVAKPHQDPSGIWVTCANSWKVFIKHSDSAEEAQGKVAEYASARQA